MISPSARKTETSRSGSSPREKHEQQRKIIHLNIRKKTVSGRHGPRDPQVATRGQAASVDPSAAESQLTTQKSVEKLEGIVSLQNWKLKNKEEEIANLKRTVDYLRKK